MRRLAAIFALVGLVTSPAIARTRLFCKYTGIEITDCTEGETPPAPALTASGCCEHRVLLPLDTARTASAFQDLFSLPVAAKVATELVRTEAQPRAVVPKRACAAGPPLFVRHRALLI